MTQELGTSSMAETGVHIVNFNDAAIMRLYVTIDGIQLLSSRVGKKVY